MLKKVSILILILMLFMTQVTYPVRAGEEKTLYYPEFVQEMMGEELVLEKAPERIVCLSNAALQILARLDIRPVAGPSISPYYDYPEWVSELPVIESGMRNLDVEGVIALEPDLLILGSHLKESYEQQLNDAGIPVYFTSEGPSVNYEETKQQSIAIAQSFGDDDFVKEIEEEFAEVEKRAAEYKAGAETERMMIFFHEPGAYQQTSMGYLGSMLALLPYENLSDEAIGAEMRTVPMDVETAITMNPDVIFAISPASRQPEVLQESFEKGFAENPDLWNQISAIRNNNIHYLSSEYVTTKGMLVVDSIHKLIDALEGDTGAASEADSDAQSGLTIIYPENMQEKGFTEPVVLAEKPTRVASLSTAPVLALHALGVEMIAVPQSKIVEWPEDLVEKVELLQLGHGADFNIETVVSMNPDLVILGDRQEDTYGKILQDLDIPVYYVDSGHTVSYESIKIQTKILIDAFGPDSEAGREMLARFDELEERVAELAEENKGKKVMVLQSAPPDHYIQSEKGTLANMAKMLGYDNVFVSDGPGLVPMDMEAAVHYDPDLVLCVGMSPTPEGHQKVMEEDFVERQDYWDTIEAVKNRDVVYLPINYISSSGITVIDQINDLADAIRAHYE